MKSYLPGHALIPPTPRIRSKWMEQTSLREGALHAVQKWVRERFQLATKASVNVEECIRCSVGEHVHKYTVISFEQAGIECLISVDKPLEYLRRYDIEHAVLQGTADDALLETA